MAKIDHIDDATESFHTDISGCQAFRYPAQFVERALRDVPNKQLFIKEFDGTLIPGGLERQLGRDNSALLNSGMVDSLMIVSLIG